MFYIFLETESFKFVCNVLKAGKMQLPLKYSLIKSSKNLFDFNTIFILKRIRKPNESSSTLESLRNNRETQSRRKVYVTRKTLSVRPLSTSLKD